jgi:hypothetical protein
MSKAIVLVSIVLTCCFTTSAQVLIAPLYSSYSCSSEQIETDTDGNIHVLSSFKLDLKLGNYKASDKSGNHVLIRYSPDGDILSARQFNFPFQFKLHNKHIILAGSFSSPIQLGKKKLTPQNEHDVFIAQLSYEGKLMWVKQVSDHGDIQLSNLEVDPMGNIYISGTFDQKAHFGYEILRNTQSSAVFVAKYDNSGMFQWANKGESSLKNGFEVPGMVIDKSGNVIIAGTRNGNASFNNLSINGSNAEITTNSVEGNFLYMTKFNADGEVKWFQEVGKYAKFKAISTDTLNNIYIAGFVKDVKSGASYLMNSIGDNSVKSTFVKNEPTEDAFLAKFDKKAKLMWLKKATGKMNNVGTHLEFDPYNNTICLGGLFSDKLEIGDEQVNAKGQECDIFIARFDPDGNLKELQSGGGTHREQINDLACDSIGNIFVTGDFRESMICGETELTSESEQEEYNSFVLRYNY